MNKIFQIPIIRIVIAILFVSIGVVIGQAILSLLRSIFSITNVGLANLLAFILLVPVIYLAYWIYVRYVEKRNLTELDARNALQEFGVGSVIGFGLFGLVIALLWLSGFYRVSGINLVWILLIGALFGALASAFAQELIFRAIIYRITEEWLGTWWALAVSAALFGLIHLTSAGGTIFSAVSIALQAGILLAAAYALTHRLWLALGLHAMWDFANDAIFGVGVAGQTGKSLQGLLQAGLHGPDLITGGALGVEASLFSLIVALIAGIIMLRIVAQRGYFISRKKELTSIPNQGIS